MHNHRPVCVNAKPVSYTQKAQGDRALKRRLGFARGPCPQTPPMMMWLMGMLHLRRVPPRGQTNCHSFEAK